MSKWTTPGIGFTEVDNTNDGDSYEYSAIGAIAFQSNVGIPNQRVLSNSLSAFEQVFGEAENNEQYGHMAARLYFDYGGSEALYGIRATMGDETYAQIQYPLTDSVDFASIDGTQYTNYTNNEGTDELYLINTIDTSVYAIDTDIYSELSDGDYAYVAKSKASTFQDVYDMFNSIDTSYTYIYRELSTSEITGGTAYYFNLNGAFTVNSKSGSNKDYEYTKIFTTSSRYLVSIAEDTYASSSIVYAGSTTSSDTATFNVSTSDYFYVGDTKYSLTYIYLPATWTLNGNSATIKIYTTASNRYSYTLDNLAAASYNATLGSSSYYCSFKVQGVTLLDWSDGYYSTYVVATAAPTDTPFADIELFTESYVYGMAVTPYGEADTSNYLVTSASGFICSEASSDTDRAKMAEVANDYGIDSVDIATSAYGIVTYTNAKTMEEESKLVKVLDDYSETKTGVKNISSKSGLGYLYTYTWILFLRDGSTSITIASNYGTSPSENLLKPWQIERDLTSDNEYILNKLTALSTTEALAIDKYSDGYTKHTTTSYDPGNGDIERYSSVKSKQIIIAAPGPGAYGNNVGVSVITPEAAQYPVLYNQNIFNWKYKYDDTELVDSDPGGNDYESNTLDLTWKKVYRVNVYVKSTSQSESIWGSGLEALKLDPVESWLVSNDPTAVDTNGESLYAPTVINGNSNYIYISRDSVTSAQRSASEYSMPVMTFSIYQLTGGKNSLKNDLAQKTRALSLYSDNDKCDLDYIFNVEPTDDIAFSKFRKMQNTIAKIAVNREKCLGFIQTDSTEAMTIKRKLSESKDITTLGLSNLSYVAGYEGYDLYFDPYTTTNVYLPRSIAGAVLCAYVDNYYYPWLAPAGTDRGRIRYSQGSLSKLNSDEFGQLYTNNVNSALDYTLYGSVVMGQKTLQKKETALNRIDIRKTCNYIEKNLEALLLPYLFQKNTANTRASIKSTVDTFLSKVEAGEGIISRTVTVTTDSDDPRLLYVNVTFVPAESIERIEVILTLNRDSGSVTASDA